MNRLSRYIYQQSVTLSLVVLLSLTAAFWLVQSLKLIEFAVDRGIGATLFAELMLLSLPQLFHLILPAACFIGVLFTYNKLIGDSELIVMRACGASQWQLARPALALALTGIAVMLALSLYLLPASRNAFKDMQFAIRNQFTAGLLQEGVFNTLSDRLTVYVRTRSADALVGLLLQDMRDPTKPSTFTAERGLLTEIDGRPSVLMLNGTKGVWDTQKKQLSMLTFDRYSLDFSDFRDAPGARVAEPDERYLPDLFFPTDVPGDALLANRLRVEGHNRLVTPLLCASYIAVALACLLTGELNRRGQTRRLLLAIALVVVIQVSILGSGNLAGRANGVVWPLYLIAVAPIVGGIGVLGAGHNLSRLAGFIPIVRLAR